MPLRVISSILSAHIVLSASGNLMPFIVGHRGFAAQYPENTLLSLQAALDAGADGIESDLQLTADGVLILLHDETLDRTTNCTGPVASFTLAQLQGCNAAYVAKYGSKYGFVPIPTFEQALALVVSRNAFFVMDLKAGLQLGSVVQPLLDRYAAWSNVVASCWTFDQVADAAQYLNASARQFLNDSASDLITANASAWSAYTGMGVRGFSLGFRSLTPAFVAAAHARLMPVFAWTVDDSDDVNAVIDVGVDGIITNDVANAVSVISARLSHESDYFDESVWYSRGQFASGITAAVFASLVAGAAGMYLYFKRMRPGDASADYSAVPRT